MKKVSIIGATFAVAIGVLGVASPQVYAVSQTCTWTGAGGDSKFSTATNWSGCNSSVPQAGDVVRITASSITADADKLTNDLNVDLGGVITENDTPSGQSPATYSVWVSSLSLVDGGYVSTPGSSSYGLSVGNGTSRSPIVGKGNLELRGYNPGLLDVAGTLKISKNGDNISLNPSIIDINSPNRMSAIEIFDNAVIKVGNQTKDRTTINTAVPITVRSGAKAGIHFNSACAELGQVGWSVSALCLQELDTTHNYSGTLTLEDDLTVTSGTKSTVNLTGTISNKDKIVRGAVGTVNIGGAVFNNPVITTDLDGDKVGEVISVVQNQTAILKEGAVRSTAEVYSGGVLKGVGSIKYGIYVYNGGKIAPGLSPGCLTANFISLAGEYEFELGGTSACTGYDQIKILGQSLAVGHPAIEIGGTGNDTAILTTIRFDGYTPKQGEVYVIIDNQSSTAIEGTFKGLAEGATFNQDGVVYKISYVGGDGNDVTLTVMNQPTVPDTGFGVIKANPVVTAVVTAVAALVLVVMGRRLQVARK